MCTYVYTGTLSLRVYSEFRNSEIVHMFLLVYAIKLITHYTLLIRIRRQCKVLFILNLETNSKLEICYALLVSNNRRTDLDLVHLFSKNSIAISIR